MLDDPFDQLLQGYGYRPMQKGDNLRYQDEETFIDLWHSKKGTTVGIYHPKTQKVTYCRRVNIDKLEGLLISIEKETWKLASK